MIYGYVFSPQTLLLGSDFLTVRLQQVFANAREPAVDKITGVLYTAFYAFNFSVN